MSRNLETVEDTAALVIGGVVFTVVAALTAAVMAVGFAAIETVGWLRQRS
jgi:hypothetical protein